MHDFLEYFFLGITNGSIYASLALALVILVKTIHQPNLSQGEIATLTTIIAWFLINLGMPYWLAFASTIVIAFILGAMLQAVFFRLVEDAPASSQFMVLVGMFLMINGVSGLVFGYDPMEFPAPFEQGAALFGTTLLDNNDIVSLLVIGSLVVLMTLFYNRTKIGLALRAIAQNHTSSALMGINVSFMLMLNWGISASIGATSGMLIAPVVYLDPNMMLSILVFSLAGAVLGGMNSPFGAVVGCLLVGLINAILVNYLDIIDRQLEIAGTLFIVVLVLIFKPEGLFSKVSVKRV